ncbi:MAG: efflux RND transporter periplasmic adaptor subunit [Verrucomicrobiota bacterium]|jgi:multidrug efflux system membrane fusion protein
MDEQKQPPAGVSAGQSGEPQSHQAARRWPWVLIIVALVLLLGFIAYWTHRQPRQSAGGGGRFGGGGGTNTMMISTATATNGDIGIYVEALGTVTPVYTVSVAARVAGQIVKVNYQEGQHVRVGDSLVEIDPGPYQAAVDQAQGQLEHDAALLEDARIDLARYKEALSSNAIPAQQYETQLATVHEDEGLVKLDQGNLDSAKVNLAYCHITSPITGRVGLRLVDPGNLVQANGTTPLVVVAQLQPITVIFTVAEDSLPQILAAVRRGGTIPMEVYDHEDQTKITTGTLETLDNEINTSSGTLKLRGVCSNEDESLFPNQFVNVHLLVDTLRGVAVLPNTVIQRNSDTAFVYLLTPTNTVEMHPITVGATDGTVSQVDGLEAGAVVAANNFNRLIDGAKVALRPESGGAGERPGGATRARHGAGGRGTNSWSHGRGGRGTNAPTDGQGAHADE